MGRPRKAPAFLVEATVHRSAKLASLPGDTARLGFFYAVLGEAKVAEVPGQFSSRQLFREVAGRFGRFLPAYLLVGILEEAPALCPRCVLRWSKHPPRAGVLVVHDWAEYQYDPKNLERQRGWDRDHRGRPHGAGRDAISDAISDGQSDGVSDAQSDGVSDAKSDVSGPVSDTFPTPISRARPKNVERRTTKVPSTGSVGANGAEPLLTKPELDAWARFDPDVWGPFQAAWLARGFRLPPTGDRESANGQRAILFEVLDARPSDLPRWVAEARAGASAREVVGHVLRKWRGVKAQAST